MRQRNFGLEFCITRNQKEEKHCNFLKLLWLLLADTQMENDRFAYMAL